MKQIIQVKLRGTNPCTEAYIKMLQFYGETKHSSLAQLEFW